MTKNAPCGLYTVILDYRGGTYISQVRADGPREALVTWANELDYSEIKYLGKRGKQRLIDALENDPYGINAVTELGGLKNAWCGSVTALDGLINIVKTAQADRTLAE
jgi:hypothetical protein